MKDIELKNCPNCKERIGKHDIECPFCKYIDDPKYKNYNDKLKKKKKKKTRKSGDDYIYKIILLMPILILVFGLIFDINKHFVLPLMFLDVLCLFIKKKFILWIIIIEIIVMSYNFVFNILDSFEMLKNEIIILLLGIIFIVIPKIIYCFMTKKKKKIIKKNRNE